MKTLFCTIILFFGFSFTFAHTCATYTHFSDKEHSKKLSEVDSIFEGETISIKDEGDQSYLIKLKVIKVWKGDKAKEVVIKYADLCGMGAPLPTEKQVGRKWLIYGYAEKRFEPHLYVGCCHPFDDDRMKKEYGEGIVIDHPGEDSEQPNINTEGFWSGLWKKIISFFS